MFYAAIVVLTFFGPMPSSWKLGIIADKGSPYKELIMCEEALARLQVVVATLPRHEVLRSGCDSLKAWKEFLGGQDPWMTNGEDAGNESDINMPT